MKRRQFNRRLVAFCAVASGAPLLSRCTRNARNLQEAIALERISSTEGLLELSLTAKAQTQAIAGEQVKLLTYNGQVPGPMLEARAGDTVRITLENELEVPTNLHYHGLHISPAIDNVFREVSAGVGTASPTENRYTYEFQIPDNHPAVTGWYHPHYHLRVASQVFGGLAGPFIIRGELDEIPEIQQAEEAVLLLKDFEPRLQNGSDQLSPLAEKWGREGHLLTANAQQNPVIGLPQNGLLRLRLINASASRIYQLQLPEHPWFLIATDRGAIAQPTELETLTLSPGERAELLIPGNREANDYKIWSLPYDRGIAEMIDGFGKAIEQMPGVVPPQKTAIATLRYKENERTTPLPLPTQLVAVEPLPEPDITREFVLNHGIDSTAGSTGFIINGESFVMDKVNTRVRLNQVEDWRIVNKASVDHPFHLHTNRFQVVERNGKADPFRAWKDTVNIGGYETVTIRTKFEDFTGRTVYHCHILDHEDQGMMGIVEIQA